MSLLQSFMKSSNLYTNYVFHRILPFLPNEGDMHTIFFLYVVDEGNTISARYVPRLNVYQNRHFPKGPFAMSFEFLFYTLAILANKRHFCHFRQICHFRQNRHFAKGPFAISFEFLFILWRFWRLIAISAIFANACISGHISIFSEFQLCIGWGTENWKKISKMMHCFEVFWYSFSETTPMFFNLLKSDFILVRSLQNFHQWLTMNWSLSKCSF